jgi:hypothetical protein
MPLCPWCNSEVPSAAAACTACGRNPADHPSLLLASHSPFDDDDLGPPVDLALARASPSASHDGAYGYDDRFDDDFDGGLGASPSAETALRDEAVKPPVRRRAPSTPDLAHTAALDPVEIAILADFGPAPSSLWSCPAYALRVARRTAELNRLLRTAQKNAGEAAAVRDEHLAALAEKLRPAVSNDRELAGFLGPLEAAEQTARDREAALGERSDAYAGIVGAIDDKLAVEEQTATELKRRVDAARQQHAERAQLLTRAQAALKRAEIELRNAQEVARAAAGPDARTAPPEHAPAILQAQTSLEQRRQELGAPKSEAERAAAALQEAETRLREVERRISQLRAERRQAEATFSREMGLRSEGLEQARAQRRAALISIGARLFETNSDHIPEPDYDAFHRVRADLSARHLEVERTMRALTSADKSAAKKGWMLIAGALVSVLALLILSLVFSSR